MIDHPYKLLVIDIDGTLIGKDRTISAEDKEALAKTCRLGIKVSLSTGRVTQACLGILNQLSLDGYHIFFDGALVSNPTEGKEVHVRPLDKMVVKQAIEFAHWHNIDLELYSAMHYFAERETWSTNAHRQFFGIEPAIVDFTDLWNQEKILKGGLVAITSEGIAKARSFSRQFGDSLRFSRARSPAYPDIDFINIVAPGVSKGKALEVLASHLGVSMSEIVAVGDGTNDILLLSSVGLAIAMDNAPDEVKAVADHITLNVDHSGIAAAINKFLL